MNIPAELKYSETDEWVKVDGKVATLGVTDFAQDQLSDVVYVEIIVAVGDAISKGQQIATVESVKAAADINGQVSGKVIAINEALGSEPELVNKDPYGAAWMVKIELDDPAEADTLLDAAAYEASCASRSH